MTALKTHNPRRAGTSAPAADIWVQYVATRDKTLREQLILENASLVKYVVDRMAISLPACLEYEDLISHGIMGLMQAVDRYDPSRGVPFGAYAVTRIRGQVLDALRRLDLVPRSTRQRAREIEGAIRDLRHKLGRNPTDEEIADYLGMTMDAVRTNLQNATCILVPMDGQLLRSDDGEEGLSLSEVLEDEQTPTPAEELDERDTRERLRAALLELTERERLVLSLYHEKELTMKEVGQVLGVSESRVSQIYSKVILTLRAMIAICFLVGLSPLFLGAAGTMANGVPVKVFLNYLPDVSNWGPETASAEAVLAVGEGWVTISVKGLPKLQGEVYVAWVVTQQGLAIPLGKFNTDDAGAGDFEIRELALPHQAYRLLLITVEDDLDQYPAPSARRSIAGRLPDPELRAVPPAVATPTPSEPGGSADPNSGPENMDPNAEPTALLTQPSPTPSGPLFLPVTGAVVAGSIQPDIVAVWAVLGVLGLAFVGLIGFIGFRQGWPEPFDSALRWVQDIVQHKVYRRRSRL
jgi:RNA polymerase sigma factor for flagellar operon FliA